MRLASRAQPLRQEIVREGNSRRQSDDFVTEKGSSSLAGTLKGVGKVYIQTVLDCFSRYVWARLYTPKMPVTVVRILDNHVLPFFEEHGVKVETVLSDNGREYCGREDQHPYELFLQLEEIEHRTTQVGRPQSIGAGGEASRCHQPVVGSSSGGAPTGDASTP